MYKYGNHAIFVIKIIKEGELLASSDTRRFKRICPPFLSRVFWSFPF